MRAAPKPGNGTQMAQMGADSPQIFAESATALHLIVHSDIALSVMPSVMFGARRDHGCSVAPNAWFCVDAATRR
jgi:hypothetical protein